MSSSIETHRIADPKLKQAYRTMLANTPKRTLEDRMTNTELEKASPKTPEIITTPAEYRGALLHWQEQNRYHVLTPFANISGLAPQHGVITTLVQINADKNAGEIYDGKNDQGRSVLPYLKSDEVALAKNGLRKVAEGLGISTRLEHVSVGAIQFYWHVKAIGSYRGVDGSIQVREASQEWDLREGSPRLKGWTADQISEGRKHGLRNCETRALNAVIRECGAGVRQKYTRAELAKPFLTIRVMFVPDMNDPRIKQLVTERALAGTQAMYPALAPASGGIDVVEQDAEATGPKHVGRGSTEPTPPADDDTPPTKDAVRIVDVKDHHGARKDGSKWTRFVIVDSRGVQHSTFDTSLAEYAEKAKASRQWVEVTEEVDGDFRNLVEIAPAGQNPTLPGMGDL